ncbi:MAG: M20/M25/M40 family metallo-hydrolase [Sphingobacteriales bacterium]|nr:M20/M25/M40 family metallo-hydrolase [Sphingobacteriales bacterium]
MINFIQDIITRFGGRYFGSEQEKNAQYYTADILKKYCDKVEVEEFQSPLEAHFQALKIFCVVYIVVLVFFKIDIRIAAGLGFLNTVLFLGHFVTYRHWLDFLFPNKPSWNVIGDIEPQQTATSTIIIAGHMDSVKEFKWWYNYKQTGVVLSVIAGIQISLLGLYALLSLFITAVWFSYIWWLFVIITPILIVFYDMHGEDVVDGASDNLTGVAVAVEMAKVFSVNKLKNTRVRVISFGSEEAALRGSFAYAKKHKQQLLDEKAFLFNLDSIKDLEHLTVVSSEINTLVFYNKEHIQMVENAFKGTNTVYKKLPLGVGATDASAFHIHGLPAIAVIGMDSEHLDPTYHTRLDKIECLNPETMEAMKRVLVNFIETWDKK